VALVEHDCRVGNGTGQNFRHRVSLVTMSKFVNKGIGLPQMVIRSGLQNDRIHETIEL
jgi:hypothetical protein